MALQQGMSNQEISSFLSGSGEFIKPKEAKAILFEQHFADTRGFPAKDTFDAIVNIYGEERAEIIFAAVQIMIAGNMYGIPFSAFQERLKGQTYKDSSLFYELGMLIGGIILLPVAMLHGILRGLMGLSNKQLDKRESIQE